MNQDPARTRAAEGDTVAIIDTDTGQIFGHVCKYEAQRINIGPLNDANQ